ncbi:MAG: HAMP domain-containing sensor histidine kinase, partial [Bacteroidota bacterium]
AVHTALTQVAEEPETQEEMLVRNNGFTKRGRSNSPLLGAGKIGGGILKINEGIIRNENGTSFFQSSIRGGLLHQYEYFQNQPLEDRIDLASLHRDLRTELTNQRIEGKVEYGVYDLQEGRFIIHDGSYLPPSQGDTSLHTELFQSQHKVSLFDYAGEPAGYLMAQFAERNTAIWFELWRQFAASLLFIIIILGCFGYTIYVIQRQKKVSEMKTDFINNMTHEFKTPIATISLATDSIMSPKISGNPEKVARFANIIKQENKRMNSQVEKVLQMAKLDKQELKLKITPVHLHEIINNAVEYIGLQVEPRGGQVSTQLNAKPALVEADQTHLSNVINNLLDNANKYSPESPIISVSTRNLKEGVEVTVSDQGMGMSKEARKHVFDRFYRVHTGDRHDVKGFGLGLSYVKTIVEAHGGAVSVKSELGRGSSFSVFFPYQPTK